MIWKVLTGLLIAAVVVPLVMGRLHALANRSRISVDVWAEPAPIHLRTEQERWENTFDMRHPEVVESVERKNEADAVALYRIEQRCQAGLNKMWAEVRRVCKLDDWDEAWCELGAELVADLMPV